MISGNTVRKAARNLERAKVNRGVVYGLVIGLPLGVLIGMLATLFKLGLIGGAGACRH